MKRSFTLAELSHLTGAQWIGNPQQLISGVDALETATSADISFLANSRYSLYLRTTSAGAVCIDQNTAPLEGKNYLVSPSPSETFQQLAKLLCPPPSSSGFRGVHPSAVIHPTAILSEDVEVGPLTVIEQGVEIGKGTVLSSQVYIGAGVKIGANCYLHPQTVVREDCILGDRVILQPGAVIGSCGFGYLTDATGRHSKLEQLGIVILEDDVEIGANTTIDRARFKATRVGKGTKIDNLVQVGHNVSLGSHNIIVSQTGIAGSSRTGRNVVMGGQAGIVGHVEIADFVMIATRGGVSKSIKEAGKYAGEPVMSLSDHNRMQVHLRKIEDYVERIQELEKKLSDLLPPPSEK